MAKQFGYPSRPLRILATLAVIASLYVGRELFIPISLAVLLTLLLSPLVWRLCRLGIPRGVAVAIVVLAAGALTFGIGALVVNQGFELAARLPDYRENLISKVRDIKSSGGSGTIAKVSGTIKELQDELANSNSTESSAAAVPTGPPLQPVQVEVVDKSPAISGFAALLAGPLLSPLAGVGVTILLLTFLLFQSDDVRDRLIWLAGMRKIRLSTSAADEIATRIARYLRTQLLINVSHGVMVFFGLWLVGVPWSLFWGASAAVLRFVPFLGPWIAGLAPTLLAAAVFPYWGHALAAVLVFALAELVTNLLLEPWLYSTSTGISSLGVVLAAVFWAWLWGPIGLILAVPITVCLVVLGRHVPQFSLISQLFEAQSAVPIVGKLYQRLLVGDEASSALLLSQNIAGRPLAETCDQLLLPVLRQIKRDLVGGVIERSHARDALGLLERISGVDSLDAGSQGTLNATTLCIAGQNQADDVAAKLFVLAARNRGIATTLATSHALAGEVAALCRTTSARFAVVVQVAPISSTHSRRLAKVLTRLPSPLQLVIDLAVRHPAGTTELTQAVRSENTFASALERLAEACSVAPSNPADPAVRPALV